MEVTSSSTPQASSSQATQEVQNGLSSLASDDFMKLLITQLQNQDPTEPMKNDELLGQLSMMRDLQSNIELSQTLKTMSESLTASLVSQQLSAAASLIGKSVTGTVGDDQEITGIVDRAFLDNGKVYVGIGDQKVEFSHITQVNVPQAA